MKVHKLTYEQVQYWGRVWAAACGAELRAQNRDSLDEDDTKVTCPDCLARCKKETWK